MRQVLPVVGGAVGFVLGGPQGAILGANLGGMAAGAFFAKHNASNCQRKKVHA